MKIEAGKRYVRRDGSVVTIDWSDYPFRGSDGEVYTVDGNYYFDSEKTERDLVEEYVPAGLTPAPRKTLNERYGEPEQGWRWLEDDEKVEEGDECYLPAIIPSSRRSFVMSTNAGEEQCEHAKPYRRRVAPPIQTINNRYGEPEPGWRWLDDDEKVEKGDEFENNGKFTPSGNHRLHGHQDENAKPYRRRVAPPSIQLRHGGTYLTRGGSTVTVERVPDNAVFTFKSWQDTYTSDGRTHLGFSHDSDIVKELDSFRPKDVAVPVEPIKPELESIVLYECLCRYGDLWQIEWVSDTTLRGVQWQQDRSNPGYMISTTCPDEVLRTGKSQWTDLAGLRRDQPKV